MAWAIAALALAVLLLGWWWSRGTGGELPELEDRRPRPRLPEGEFTAADVAAVRFATARKGYSQRAVNALLAKVEASLDGRGPVISGAFVASSRFGVEVGGYDLEQVDLVLDRLSRQLTGAVTDPQSASTPATLPEDGEAELRPGSTEPVAADAGAEVVDPQGSAVGAGRAELADQPLGSDPGEPGERAAAGTQNDHIDTSPDPELRAQTRDTAE